MVAKIEGQKVMGREKIILIFANQELKGEG